MKSISVHGLAHALETASVLVTYDAHFAAAPGLRLWDELR